MIKRVFPIPFLWTTFKERKILLLFLWKFGSCDVFWQVWGVQRWGLAALGTICSAEDALAKRAVDAGGAKSVIWALGADVLSQVGANGWS